MIASAVVGVLILFTGCGIHLDPTRVAPARWLEPPKVSAQAQQLYSKEQLSTAYEELTQMTFDKSFEASLLDPQQREYTAEQLNAGVTERMTPGLRNRWDARVAAALSGNEEVKDGVRILRFFDWEQPNWNLPKNGRPLLSQRIRDVEIGVNPATPEMPQRLKVTLIIDASMEYQEAGVHFPMLVSKRISHWLLPAEGSAGFAWSLDEYEGVFAVNEDLPVEKDAQTELPPPPPSQVEDRSNSPGEEPSDSVAQLAAVPMGQPETRESYGFGSASKAADAPPSSPKVASGASPLLRPGVANPSSVNRRPPGTSQLPAMAERPPVSGPSAPASSLPPRGTLELPSTSQPPRTQPASPPRAQRPSTPRAQRPSPPPRTQRPSPPPPPTTQRPSPPPPPTTQRPSPPPRTQRPSPPPRTQRPSPPPRTQRPSPPPRTQRPSPPPTTQPPPATPVEPAEPTRTTQPPATEEPPAPSSEPVATQP